MPSAAATAEIRQAHSLRSQPLAESRGQCWSTSTSATVAWLPIC